MKKWCKKLNGKVFDIAAPQFILTLVGPTVLIIAVPVLIGLAIFLIVRANKKRKKKEEDQKKEAEQQENSI